MKAIETATMASVLGLSSSAVWTDIKGNRGKGVWRVDSAGERFVVRVLRVGKDASAAHEVHMMEAARRGGLPVAQVRATAHVADRPVLLADWTPGTDLSAELRARPWRAFRLGRLFGEQQARMHAVQEAPSSAWIDYFESVDPAMRERLEDGRSMSSLIHLDYHPANLVIDRGAISGILDWTNARVGDPRADLARTWALLTLVFRAGRRRPVRRLAEHLFARGWWLSYCLRAGRPREMALYRAWAVSGLVQERRLMPPSASLDADCLRLERIVDRYRRIAGLPSAEHGQRPTG